MPSQAWALVLLFSLCSLALGYVAVRIAARVGGPTRLTAYVLPMMVAFFAFYAIGHRLGVSIGPEISLLGFQVALLGDLAIGFAAALATALVQAAVVRSRRGRPADATDAA